MKNNASLVSLIEGVIKLESPLLCGKKKKKHLKSEKGKRFPLKNRRKSWGIKKIRSLTVYSVSLIIWLRAKVDGGIDEKLRKKRGFHMDSNGREAY